MHLHHTTPTVAQLTALRNYPPDQPVVMVNIIKYQKETAEGESGETIYQRYLQNALPLIQKAGARLVWRGEVGQTVIGEEEGQPDAIFLVEYPSIQHFMEMISSEEYQKIAKDRGMALEYGGLMACKTTT